MSEGIDVVDGDGKESATSARRSAPDVFISYASQDTAVANPIVEALEKHGVSCWIAPRDVVPGCLYADEIVGAINESRVVVLILSEHSVESAHVGKEIERASSKRRRIIVMRTDTAPLPRTFEYFLSESQWIESRPEGTEVATAKLVEAVRRHLNPGSAAERRVYSDMPGAGRVALPRWKWAVTATVIVVTALGWLLTGRLWPLAHGVGEKPVAAASIPATAKIPEKSVAVLPFVDMSEKKDQEYFSDGLSEELIDMLTRVPELHVPARTSSFYFKGKQTTIADIAKELGVEHVLEGSVRKNGRTIRITAQLIRADTGYHVWSKTYDRKFDDIFKIQDEIADAVVSALRTSLSTNTARGAPKSSNADSYSLLMQAQFFLFRQTLGDQQKAFEYYQRAIDSDPMSATAWAGLSRTTANLWALGTMPWKDAHNDALQSAVRAVTLDPQLADAHIALGKVYLNLGEDYAAAKREFDTARALDPESTITSFWSAVAALAAGDIANAEQLLRQAVAKDPLDGETYMLLGQTYYYAGRFAEAEVSYRKALDLIPARPGVHGYLGLVLLAKGAHEEALQEIGREADTGEHDAVLAGAYQILGRTTEARSALAQLEATRVKSAAYWIAKNYALRGDRERTFLWLDRGYQQHEYLMELKADPWFSSARGDPRYQALLRKLNLPDP